MSRRRNGELILGMHVVIVVVGGYVLLALSQGSSLPPDLGVFLAEITALYVVANVAMRRFAPGADGTLLPLVALLNGLGFVIITRLDPSQARVQAVWTTIGVGVFVATLIVVRDLRRLERYRYTAALAGIGFLLLPLMPAPIGLSINGARLWAKLGPISFQPGEVAKVLLVVFFAGYLVEKRELLTAGSRRIGRLHVPDPKHLGPLLLVWGASIMVLVFERDLGSSLLLFSVFSAMLYVATNRSAYLLGGLALFSGGTYMAYKMFAHVRTRFEIWWNPWPSAQGKGYQIVQAWYSFAAGHIGGLGLGKGLAGERIGASSWRLPEASTDSILAVIGEELGLVGTLAVVIAFLLLIGAGLRTAIDHPRPFEKLFATGLTVIIGVQAFVIIGGITRVIPLTGLTLPFVSYGGSSLVANFALIALLARVSDDAAQREVRR
jgi:cell division protein FtsW (lipid II flippase)